MNESLSLILFQCFLSLCGLFTGKYEQRTILLIGRIIKVIYKNISIFVTSLSCRSLAKIWPKIGPRKTRFKCVLLLWLWAFDDHSQIVNQATKFEFTMSSTSLHSVLSINELILIPHDSYLRITCSPIKHCLVGHNSNFSTFRSIPAGTLWENILGVLHHCSSRVNERIHLHEHFVDGKVWHLHCPESEANKRSSLPNGDD